MAVKQQIPKWEEFLKLDDTQQKKLLKDLSAFYTQKQVKDGMGATTHHFKKIRQRLGLIESRKKPVKKDASLAKPKSTPDHTPKSHEAPKNESLPSARSEHDQQTIRDLTNKVEYLTQYLEEKAQKDLEAERYSALQSGLSMNLSGEYTPNTLKKKLEKLSLMVEGESNLFQVTINVVEMDKPLEHDEKKFQTANDGIRNEELSDEEAAYNVGYNHLRSTENGLHHPESEYTTVSRELPNDDDEGVKIVNGVQHYQCYYICKKHACGHKGRRYIQRGSVYVNCTNCGTRMNVKDATETGFPSKDTFGNFYVAGKFVPNYEYERKHKPLSEIWGAD